MIKVETLEHPQVEVFKSLKDKVLSKEGLMLCESEKVVLKLLKSNQKVLKVFIDERFYEHYKDLLIKKVEQDSIFVASKDLMQEIVGHKLHQGIMAICHRPEYISAEELEDKILVLNGLTSPENVGTIVRTCAAFNIRTLVIDSKTCSPYLRRCIRVSMGNIFSIKVHRTDNLEDFIRAEQKKDREFYATANVPGAVDVSTIKYSKKCALITGSEGHGIDQNIIDLSDQVIKISIDEDVAHLNAAMATSIFLYTVSQN